MNFRKLSMRFASFGLVATLLTGAMTTSALAAAGTSDDGTESPEVTASEETQEITVTLPVSTSLNVVGDIHPEEPAPFTFTMTRNPEDKDEPLPMAIDEETGEEEEQEPPATIVIHGEGTGEFDVTFTEPGTYTYLIDQEDGDHDGYTYDQAQYLVKVRVSYDRHGNLQTYTIIKKDGEQSKSPDVVFLNEYEGTPIVETEEPTTSPEPTTPATESPVTSETPVNTETPAVEKPAVESPAEESPVTSTGTATPAPVKSATTQTITKTATATPKTGDSSNLFRWVVVLAVMLMGAVTCVWYLVITKKHNKDSES